RSGEETSIGTLLGKSERGKKLQRLANRRTRDAEPCRKLWRAQMLAIGNLAIGDGVGNGLGDLPCKRSSHSIILRIVSKQLRCGPRHASTIAALLSERRHRQHLDRFNDVKLRLSHRLQTFKVHALDHL